MSSTSERFTFLYMPPLNVKPGSERSYNRPLYRTIFQAASSLLRYRILLKLKAPFFQEIILSILAFSIIANREPDNCACCPGLSVVPLTRRAPSIKVVFQDLLIMISVDIETGSQHFYYLHLSLLLQSENFFRIPLHIKENFARYFNLTVTGLECCRESYGTGGIQPHTRTIRQGDPVFAFHWVWK